MRPESAIRFRAFAPGKRLEEAYNLRLALFLRRLSKNHAKNGSSSMDPGIAQINKYGLTLDADRTISLSLLFSSGVHLPPCRCFINSGQAPRM